MMTWLCSHVAMEEDGAMVMTYTLCHRHSSTRTTETTE